MSAEHHLPQSCAHLVLLQCNSQFAFLDTDTVKCESVSQEIIETLSEAFAISSVHKVLLRASHSRNVFCKAEIAGNFHMTLGRNSQISGTRSLGLLNFI